MPLNKEALIRYRVINRLLLNKKYVSKSEIISACEEALDVSPIAERTIDKDICDMRFDTRLGYFAPIKYSRQYKGYYYEDENYSIDNIPINDDELNALIFAASILNQFKEIELLSTFAGTVQKLNDILKIKRKQHSRQPLSNFIELEKAPYYKGSENLNPIVDAIQQKKVIEFDYTRFDTRKTVHHVLHPYLLKEYNNRWYVIGFHNGYKNIRTFGLERISNLEVNPNIKFINTAFDSSQYFKNTVGLIISDKVEEIILKFQPLQAQYVITRPIHESQEIIEDTETHITISLKVNINYELVSIILGFGNDVEVISPVSLRKKMKEIFMSLLEKYDD